MWKNCEVLHVGMLNFHHPPKKKRLLGFYSFSYRMSKSAFTRSCLPSVSLSFKEFKARNTTVMAYLFVTC